MNSPQILYTQLTIALKMQDYEALTLIVEEYAKEVSANTPLIFLHSKMPFKDLVCINSLAQAYSLPSYFNYAEVFSKASIERAEYLIRLGINYENEDFKKCMKDALHSLLRIYSDTGRYYEGIDVYKNICTVYDFMHQPAFAEVHLVATELCLSASAIEKANDILSTVDSSALLPPYLMIYNQLRNRIALLTTNVTSLTDELKTNTENFNKEHSIDIVNALDYLAKEIGFSIDPTDKKSFAEELQKSLGDEGTISERLERQSRGFSNLYALKKEMSGDGNSLTADEVHYRMQDILKILTNEVTSKSTPDLQNALSNFLELLNICDQKNYQDDINTLLWNVFICYWRLEEYEQSAETLEKLIARLEITRSNISDVNKRAGIFHSFPHLYPSLAEAYYRCQNYERLFNTIEASKGRNLTDKILLETGRENTAFLYHEPVGQLCELLSEHSGHYLSLFTDEEFSYSILITNQGDIVADKVPIGQKQLEQWVEKDYPNPKSWVNPISGFFGKKTDLSLLLTPFISPVEFALKEGLISAEDLIVYSPDGFMHLFPLHYIKQSNNKYLIESFALSRIHSSSQLIHLLSEEESTINEIITITTAAAGDDQEKVEKFNAVNDWFQQNTTNCIEVSPTTDDVLENMGQNQIIHFATHGSFPKKNLEDPKQNNPFFSSGLLLCNASATLPSLHADFGYYKKDNFLNPEKIVAANCNLNNSHVSMQACVSGRSKEGAAGDALGLEWAFFSLGVTSLLSANWDIDINHANQFFIKFYKYWLANNLSKAKAYYYTVNELMKSETGEYLPVAVWGGLTLSGNFK